MIKLSQSCNFQRALRKSAFLKITAQAFEAGDFLNIFLRFLGFSGSFFLYFLYKKKHVFKYNSNRKYSTKDLKGEYTGNDFSVLCAYLNENGLSAKS